MILEIIDTDFLHLQSVRFRCARLKPLHERCAGLRVDTLHDAVRAEGRVGRSVGRHDEITREELFII